MCTVAFSAKNLANKDLIGKSDPRLTIVELISADGEASFNPRVDANYYEKIVYQSETIQNNLNPNWKKTLILNVNFTELVWFKIRIDDMDGDESGDVLGMIICKAVDIMKNNEFRLEKGVLQCTVENPRKQIPIKCSVAIDLTGSNGHPSDGGSLHSRRNPRNPYKRAMQSLVSVCTQCDDDSRVPIYGFGFQDASGQTQYCFNFGDGDLIATYEKIIHDDNIVFAGPTYFSHVIKVAIENIKNEEAYHVLFIFTDGQCDDYDATIKAIKLAVDKPMSIIIVGIGKADFTAMRNFDDLRISRDVVQFVPFREYATVDQFRNEALAELPKQIIQFYEKK